MGWGGPQGARCRGGRLAPQRRRVRARATEHACAGVRLTSACCTHRPTKHGDGLPSLRRLRWRRQSVHGERRGTAFACARGDGGGVGGSGPPPAPAPPPIAGGVAGVRQSILFVRPAQAHRGARTACRTWDLVAAGLAFSCPPSLACPLPLATGCTWPATTREGAARGRGHRWPRSPSRTAHQARRRAASPPCAREPCCGPLRTSMPSGQARACGACRRSCDGSRPPPAAHGRG